mgnify:CR=1 FL=1
MKKWNLIVDVENCTNCNVCTLAVQDEHVGNSFPGYAEEMPKHGHRWIEIMRKERGAGSATDVAYLPTMCQHCDDAPCMKAAPDAVSKRPDGIVIIDPVKAKGRKDLVVVVPMVRSGGMKKRVAIARAIVLNPKYLFCDEPNSGLDPKTAIIIDKLIQEITIEYNITTVINTHDMNSVMEIGDKIIFLVQGEKVWEGNNKEILKTNNKLVNDFVYSSELLRKVGKLGS